VAGLGPLRGLGRAAEEEEEEGWEGLEEAAELRLLLLLLLLPLRSSGCSAQEGLRRAAREAVRGRELGEVERKRSRRGKRKCRLAIGQRKQRSGNLKAGLWALWLEQN
jgi:hypothetical protein